MSPTILAEPIEMLFGSCTWVGPRNNVLGGGPDSLRGKGNLGVFEPIEKLVIVRSATTAECLYYIQLYSPECTLAENIDINNNKQNKDRNILAQHTAKSSCSQQYTGVVH